MRGAELREPQAERGDDQSSRELTLLEAQVRDAVNARVSRSRLNVTVTLEATGTTPKSMLDTALARHYYKAMLDLQKELKTGGEISIETILRAPGVMKVPEEQISPKDAWEHIAKALGEALDDLIKMREKEGKHLAKDLIKRLKLVRQSLRKIRLAQPGHSQVPAGVAGAHSKGGHRRAGR
ncbi:MAG: YicC/YloC family endoribonuclease [Chthoniobacteraceae bacterium]